MNRKSVSIILAYIVLSSALGLSGYLYFDLNERTTKLQLDHSSLVNRHNILQSNYSELEYGYQTLNDTHHILINDYTQLNQTHQILIVEYNNLNTSYQVLSLNYNNVTESHQILAHNYTDLKQDHSELSSNYTTLEQDYNELSTRYASLLSDYNALSEAFDNPLSYEEIPSTDELEQWLATDETDEIQYSKPNFVCGDFAVMLSLHAKTEQWDIGVVAVFGHTESDESFAHAFNAMICEEGLVYVEPQTDEVWSYENHEEITEGNWWEFPDVGHIYVEECIIILWYD